MRHRALLAAVIAVLAIAGGIPGAAAQQKMKVVASFTILADMAREIGGDAVSVRTLVGPDGDAHVFQPTPADARAVSEARVLIVNGLGFEGWLDRLQRASGFRSLTIIASEGVRPLAMDGSAAASLVPDPHAWQDPANGRLYVDNIARGFAAADPANASAYAERAERYKRQLVMLEAEIRAGFDAIPDAKRRVITSHDAFRYFGHAFGIDFIAVAGVSTDTEPSARQIGALIAQIRKENVRALFVENMSSARLTEQIGRDAGANIGGRLYSDSLSPPGGPADTYLRMLRYNATTLQAGMALN